MLRLKIDTFVGWIATSARIGWHSAVPYSTVLPPADMPIAPMRSGSTSARVRR